MSEQSTNEEKEPKPKPRRITSYNVMPIDKYVGYIDSYNMRNGTKYSYGQITELLRSKKIKRKEFYCKVRKGTP